MIKIDAATSPFFDIKLTHKLNSVDNTIDPETLANGYIIHILREPNELVEKFCSEALTGHTLSSVVTVDGTKKIRIQLSNPALKGFDSGVLKFKVYIQDGTGVARKYRPMKIDKNILCELEPPFIENLPDTNG